MEQPHPTQEATVTDHHPQQPPTNRTPQQPTRCTAANIALLAALAIPLTLTITAALAIPAGLWGLHHATDNNGKGRLRSIIAITIGTFGLIIGLGGLITT